MNNLKEQLQKIQFDGKTPEILFDCCADPGEYDRKRQVFNRKFQFRPAAIVFCEYSEHVSQTLIIAKELNYDIRVRSGGHDHEGECSGTDTIVIDLSKMDNVTVEKGIARIQPGNRFMKLIPELATYDVSIPHGTCGSVGIAGFTMGGGWGPWTRRYGMCCESLAGATIVLGDGTIKKLTSDATARGDKELLWALRGGGGMSYGIVTELVIKTFELPKHTIKFNVEWNNTPALKVLTAWEGIIAPDKNPKLIGTNLKIMAIPKPPADQDIEESVYDCVFYGYYDGTETELKEDLVKWFAKIPPYKVYIPDDHTADGKRGHMLGFSAWDRVSTPEALLRITAPKSKPITLATLAGPAPLQAEPIPPDMDAPAPHKITSRLVKEKGWDNKGRKTLIQSLESDLLYPGGELAGVHCYVTLGAISGPYYAQYNDPGFPDGSAFPYKKRPFTIQYQAWWDQGAKGIAQGKLHNVHEYTNRAEDWIEECRQLSFPQTEGSFISFKDAGVPTNEYFMQSYDRLKQIKESYSEDPHNRFRTRKTII